MPILLFFLFNGGFTDFKKCKIKFFQTAKNLFKIHFSICFYFFLAMN